MVVRNNINDVIDGPCTRSRSTIESRAVGGAERLSSEMNIGVAGSRQRDTDHHDRAFSPLRVQRRRSTEVRRSEIEVP
jgi:hypothetical protein